MSLRYSQMRRPARRTGDCFSQFSSNEFRALSVPGIIRPEIAALADRIDPKTPECVRLGEQRVPSSLPWPRRYEHTGNFTIRSTHRLRSVSEPLHAGAAGTVQEIHQPPTIGGRACGGSTTAEQWQRCTRGSVEH